MTLSIPDSLLVSFGTIAIISLFVLVLKFQIRKFRKKGKYSPFTEDFFRLPGHSCREYRADLMETFTNHFLMIVVLAVSAMWSTLYSNGATKILFAVICGGFVLYPLVKIYRMFDQLQAARLGCEGEEYTGQELNLLMLKGAYVFHDIPYRYGNIDHVVVGNDKVFVVETKAIRKPAKVGTRASRQATVVFDGQSLNFPGFSTQQPIKQAKVHATFLADVIKKKCGIQYSVVPVVALPGWHIKVQPEAGSSVLVINPKRGKALHKWLGAKTDISSRNSIAYYIASVARSISPKSKTVDPNADKYYDFWINPRHTEKVLGDEV